MNSKKVRIDDSWYAQLHETFEQAAFSELRQYLKRRKAEGATIYPPGEEIFAAFDLCPFDRVKAVILGQDPYHGPGEAHGLCFSVNPGVRIPPSLRNIFKELESDLGYPPPDSGDLRHWAKQGVFLLNALLTVEHKQPASHKDKGWEAFTDQVIQLLSQKKEQLVFILWGAYAKSKKALIDRNRHLILEAPHPAAEVYAGGKAGFFGSKPFSKTNEYLLRKNKEPIDWNLNPGNNDAN